MKGFCWTELCDVVCESFLKRSTSCCVNKQDGACSVVSLLLLCVLSHTTNIIITAAQQRSPCCSMNSPPGPTWPREAPCRAEPTSTREDVPLQVQEEKELASGTWRTLQPGPVSGRPASTKQNTRGTKRTVPSPGTWLRSGTVSCSKKSGRAVAPVQLFQWLSCSGDDDDDDQRLHHFLLLWTHHTRSRST